MMNATQAICCSRGCASGLREDNRHGLIYGPYGVPTGETRECSHCDGTGISGTYADVPSNGDLAGKPAPCILCNGKGVRPILRMLSRIGWAIHSGRCVYCDGPLPKGRQAYLAERFPAEQ